MIYNQILDKDLETANFYRWTPQESECFYCKRSKGCKSCSVKRDYGIKKCFMFYTVLKKFARIGKAPKEMTI